MPGGRCGRGGAHGDANLSRGSGHFRRERNHSNAYFTSNGIGPEPLRDSARADIAPGSQRHARDQQQAGAVSFSCRIPFQAANATPARRAESSNRNERLAESGLRTHMFPDVASRAGAPPSVLRWQDRLAGKHRVPVIQHPVPQPDRMQPALYGGSYRLPGVATNSGMAEPDQGYVAEE